MKRLVWIALWSVWAAIAPEPGKVVRAQSESPPLGMQRGSGLRGSTAQPASRRPEPTVLGSQGTTSQVQVAMLGYSPVSLVTTRQWVKGREPFKVVFDGAAYLLANVREKQRFAAAPERYLPALGGDCVVHLVEAGQRRPGLLRHGVVYEDRLYFLSSSEKKQAFVDNPERYAAADVALGGLCPVCLVELSKEIPGQPELAAVLGGYRYLFPGAQQREMFLAQPLRYASAAHAMAGKGAPSPTTAPAGPILPSDATDRAASQETAAVPEARAPAPARNELPAPTPVAMGGYCPVSILDENRWIRGKPEFEVVHDGKRYLLAGRPQQQAFRDARLRYVPALGGDCVISFQERGRRVEGSIYHAVIHRGRQYLFAGPQEKETFKANPDTYADADLALEGRCAVSLAEDERDVAGKPEFTAWYKGLRYQLAGKDEWEAFRKNPPKYAVRADERKEEIPPPRQAPVPSGLEDLTNPFD